MSTPKTQSLTIKVTHPDMGMVNQIIRYLMNTYGVPVYWMYVTKDRCEDGCYYGSGFGPVDEKPRKWWLDE